MVHNPSLLNGNVSKRLKREKLAEPLPTLSFISLFKYSTKWEKFLLGIGLLTCSIAGLAATLVSVVFSRLANAIIHYDRLIEITEADNEVLMKNVEIYAIRISVVLILYVLSKYLMVAIFNYTAASQVLRMRGLLFKAVMNWDITWYDLHDGGEIASRINEDLAKIEDGLGEKLPLYLHYVIALIIAFVYCLVNNWKLSLICLLPAPFIVVALAILYAKANEETKKGLDCYAQAGAVAEEVFGAVRTVHAFDGKEKEIERYRKKIEKAEKVGKRREFFTALSNAIQWILLEFYNGLALWCGMQMLVNPSSSDPTLMKHTPDDIFKVFYVLTSSVWHIGLSSVLLDSFSSAKAAGAKVLHLLKQTSNIDPLGNHGVRPVSCMGNISFNNVHFQYPSRPDVKILKGFNLSIKRGEVVAIVGHSGCGKSTCIQLIQRLYDASEGLILVDGIDIKSLNVNWLRERIGVVGQEPVLFGTTVYENIRYGREDATREEIESASKIANAHEFIMKLPQGYQTQVGERGAQLSGGQKQRIAIARAIIRNPIILLLDEATSALDTKSEAIVQDALERASKGRTTIVVAHRLSTIRNADKIVVMERGRIVDIGTHSELMTKCAIYCNLVTNQINTDGNYINEENPNTIITEEETFEDEIVEKNEELDKKTRPDHTQDLKCPSTLKILRLHPSDWPYLLVGCFCALVVGITLPITSILLGDFLGSLSLTSKEELLNMANYFGIIWVIAGLTVGLLAFCNVYFLGFSGESLTKYIREISFNAMLSQEIGWFDEKSNGTGMLCSRLSADASLLHSVAMLFDSLVY